MKKFIFLLAICVFSGFSLFADDDYDDDIYIDLPHENETITDGKLEIYISDPTDSPKEIEAQIVKDGKKGERDKTVWKGKILQKDGYKLTLDVSSFDPGEYELKLRYRVNRRSYDDDVEFYIAKP